MTIKELKQNYIQKLQTIEPDLKRNFHYESLYVDATTISKSIPLNDIQDQEVKQDLEYLATIYQAYEQKFNGTQTSYPTPITKEQEENKNIEKDKIIEGRNILYKGFPGTGKSYTVKLKYLTQKDEQGTPLYNQDNTPKLINNYKYETVVFYPEYTSTNFISCILPVTENNIITYKFVPGPFTKILKKAIKHPQTNFYLIIEEINRGNAPAIFGEIFLLLDRENHGNGRSVYEITNEFIAQEIYQNKDTKIYIPKNLSIIATMNSTDQNTTPLDSAFDRRWESIWLTDTTGINDNLFIKGFSNLTWGHFRNTINDKIKTMSTIIQTEDKKLGAYFIDQSYLSKEPTTNQTERLRFTLKVLTYLFINICQYDKQILFQEHINCIDDLINEAKKIIPIASTKK